MKTVCRERDSAEETDQAAGHLPALLLPHIINPQIRQTQDFLASRRKNFVSLLIRIAFQSVVEMLMMFTDLRRSTRRHSHHVEFPS
jgi:hypothetical protein